MFEMTEREMENFLSSTQDYAKTTIMLIFENESQIVAPGYRTETGIKVDPTFVSNILKDVEAAVTMTITHMAYDYADFQKDYRDTVGDTEHEIVDKLRDKYEGHLMSQFINYGIVFSSDVIDIVLDELILELPFLYSAAVYEDIDDSDVFLDDRLYAYEELLEKVDQRFDEELDDE
ncbi:hypothetical protein BigBertha_62 [Bacillus phage BigBertha]|uniref:Uncharacterized protein n=6 Tax=Caudoviricetes TaxID=2731619 RepID=A0A7U3TT12_9CAUD|nr:hypothetical protein TROLL_65 [Bacillus phage Troll]YP_008771089.1 hypothetical protein BigBertha_62 [Bacillus phage BigBertha]YP_009206418.1 hypothetical protein AVV02_gp063 [Bacillus phage AvesoBmore]YP_009289941.1 hypothetical protein BI003_gp062 [Bacillus phage Phrodo]AMW61494.1 hypothetical protein JUGLONE_61 [Bacillus phage Juglone]QDH49752.1 hypothetical protein BEYONPHE_65 [Bacillus phage Beyonphe]QPY77297.1 hypothetical protein ANTHOS_60 [Bacillus phage Anthos]UGO48874.1 hypothet